jgi:hypothetical protein
LLEDSFEGEVAVAFESEGGNLGPIGLVFVVRIDIEVDPAVVAGVLGDIEAFVLFEFALARWADPAGEFEEAGVIVSRGEGLGADLPGGRAELAAAGSFGEAMAELVKADGRDCFVLYRPSLFVRCGSRLGDVVCICAPP